MKLTPRQEKLRNDAHAKLKKQARSMQRDATALTGGALETGSIVQYNLADFDLAKVDKKVLTCVVVDVRTYKSGNACTYKIATKHGVLDKWIHHSYLTSKPGLTRKQMDYWTRPMPNGGACLAYRRDLLQSLLQSLAARVWGRKAVDVKGNAILGHVRALRQEGTVVQVVTGERQTRIV